MFIKLCAPAYKLWRSESNCTPIIVCRKVYKYPLQESQINIFIVHPVQINKSRLYRHHRKSREVFYRGHAGSDRNSGISSLKTSYRNVDFFSPDNSHLGSQCSNETLTLCRASRYSVVNRDYVQEQRVDLAKGQENRIKRTSEGDVKNGFQLKVKLIPSPR